MGRKKQKPIKSGPQDQVLARFVEDVLVYTLPRCGFTETDILKTGIEENQYTRANVVEIAGYSALRIALIMRDNWKRMFESRLKASGFTEDDTGKFMVDIVECCSLSRDSTVQTQVEVSLALANEILLFFHKEKVDVSNKLVIATVAIFIMRLLKSEKKFLEKLESLFDRFANIGEHVRWITEFINKCAIPYGARSGVSDLFYEEIKGGLFDVINKATVACPIQADPSTEVAGAVATTESKDSSLKTLKDHLGFLPHDLFSAIATEESASLPENLMLASGSTLPGERDSPEPSNVPPPPEKGAIEKRNLRSRRPTRSTKTSEEFRPILQVEPPKTQAGSESGNVEEKKRRGRGRRGSKKTPEEPVPLLEKLEPALEPDEPPKSHASSERGGIAEKKSGKGRAARSRKASKQTPQIQSSSVDSTEVGIEDEFRQTNLGTEVMSQRSQGAIPKKRGSRK